eukprot:COSAG06_NODE_731_length_12727_cov_14.734083_6_plen_159_part_00
MPVHTAALIGGCVCVCTRVRGVSVSTTAKPLPVCTAAVNPVSLAALSEESAKFAKAKQQFLASGGAAGSQPAAPLDSRNPRFTCAEDVAAGWAMHTAHLGEYLGPVLGAVADDFVGEEDQLVLLLDGALTTLPVDTITPQQGWLLQPRLFSWDACLEA